MSRDAYLEQLAISLDRYADVPDDVLFDVVTRDGACMWPCGHELEPPWLTDDLTDRDMAERVWGLSPRLAAALTTETTEESS